MTSPPPSIQSTSYYDALIMQVRCVLICKPMISLKWIESSESSAVTESKSGVSDSEFVRWTLIILVSKSNMEFGGR